MSKNSLVFDFGASNARAYLASFNGEKLHFSEIHRFPNIPVRLNGTLYWDILRLWEEMKTALKKAEAVSYDTVGIDTWGLDFALLDAKGDLISNPVHYRDDRCVGMMEKVRSKIPDRELYQETGIQFMRINTINQLEGLREKNPEILKRADSLLLMPDLFGYFLTGQKTQEYTMASTTGMLSASGRDWSPMILQKMAFPEKLFQPVQMPGRVLGEFREDLIRELEIQKAKVITVAGHDTASAVASVPSGEKNFAYISAGTWSLLGAEVPAPIINEKSLRYNFTNEGGADGSIRLLKNIMGMWLIQEVRKVWQREGHDYSYDQISEMARSAPAGVGMFDPDDEELIAPVNMKESILMLCKKSGQGIPQTDGSLARCIFENLAQKYAVVFRQLEELTGIRYSALHIVGGGSKNEFLNQLTADVLKIPVIAGPDEATVYGNALMQLIAEGECRDLQEGRALIAQSTVLRTYEPAC